MKTRLLKGEEVNDNNNKKGNSSLKNILLEFKVPLLQPCVSLFKWTKTRTSPCIQLLVKGLHHYAFSSPLLLVRSQTKLHSSLSPPQPHVGQFYSSFRIKNSRVQLQISTSTWGLIYLLLRVHKLIIKLLTSQGRESIKIQKVRIVLAEWKFLRGIFSSDLILLLKGCYSNHLCHISLSRQYYYSNKRLS